LKALLLEQGGEHMNFKKIFYPFAAGASLALGGRWIYGRRYSRRAKVRQLNRRMRWVIIASMTELAKISAGRVSVQEMYFFVWVVERVCVRHGIDSPGFGFEVKKGMLYSPLLTSILRKMIKDGTLRLEEKLLIIGKENPEPPLGKTERRILKVIEETSAQWKSDFPEEPLVRFGQLFR
jgi:hypothetical protein